MSNFYDTVFDSAKEINILVESLYEYSDSFYIVGNPVMGKKLSTMANELRLIRKVLVSAAGRDSSKRLAEAEQSTANMMNACLAMGTVLEEEK